MDLINSPDFESHVHHMLDKLHTPGVAMAIVQDGKAAAKAFGQASIDPPKPVTTDTLFDIASSSKSLTAASVALLVADNEKYPQVQWDSKMSALLPDDFVMSGAGYTEYVTVEDVLSHRSGLPSHGDSILGIRAKQPDTVQSIMRNLRNLQVAAPIRTKFMYSNMMFEAVTHLVEKLSGQTFEQYLHQNFFTPLGMTSTHLHPSNAIAAGLKDRLDTPYLWQDEKLIPVPWEQMPEGQGAGSIISSVTDYLKYVRALMEHEAPFTEEIYKSVTQPRMITNPEEDIDELSPYTSHCLYALGWEIEFYRGHKIVSHGGQITGSGGHVFFAPGLKLAGVILANSDDASGVGEVLFKELLDEVIGVPTRERPDWLNIHIERMKKYEDSQEKGDALKKKIWPEYEGVTEPQKIPLGSYTGEYFNAGYHDYKVEIKDDQLFVDASDRSDGYTLRFEHVCKQTFYVATLRYRLGGVNADSYEMEAEFRFENDRVVKMGIMLESDLEKMIWFDKVS